MKPLVTGGFIIFVVASFLIIHAACGPCRKDTVLASSGRQHIPASQSISFPSYHWVQAKAAGSIFV